MQSYNMQAEYYVVKASDNLIKHKTKISKTQNSL